MNAHDSSSARHALNLPSPASCRPDVCDNGSWSRVSLLRAHCFLGSMSFGWMGRSRSSMSSGAVHIYLGRYEQQKKARSDPRVDVEGQMGSSPLDPKWDLALNPLDGSPPFAPKRRTPPAESLLPQQNPYSPSRIPTPCPHKADSPTESL